MKNTNKKSTIMCVSALILALSGCSKSPETVATVGGQPVSQSEINAYLALKRIDKNNQDLVDKSTEHYLKMLALTKAIESQPKFDSAKLTVELNEIKRDLLVNRYLNQFLESAVSEVDLRNYYANNTDKYQSKQAKVSHILIRVSPNDDESVRKAKYSKAQEAYGRVMAGERFGDIAKLMSNDKVSAVRDGQLGWLKKGAIAPTFSDTVFNKLEQGQISAPILTSFGYHIILLEQAPKTVSQPFEHVKGGIKRTLRKAAKDAELARLKSTVAITL